MEEEEPFAPEYSEKDYTLVFCRRNDNGTDQILLGMKKRGNGFGGKLEEGETNEQGAIRELEEESFIRTTQLRRIGYLVFKMVESMKIMKVHVYECWQFEGEPIESDEMRPQWFNLDSIPFDSMWPDDAHWFPYMLEGKQFIGRFEYEDDETISDFTIREQP